MSVHEEIGKARWVVCRGEYGDPIIERRFECQDPSNGKIAITSLGFFVLYLNGKRIENDYFLPANSLFHDRPEMKLTFPIADRLTDRCYYTVYDLAPYLQRGENRLEIALGSGWYRQTMRIPEGNMSFGEDLGARYALEVDGTAIHSDGSERFRNSPRVYDQLYRGEVYDARIKEFAYRSVSVIDLPDTILTENDSVPDRVERRVIPTVIRSDRMGTVYDVGENISGFARIRVCAPRGHEIRIRYAENVNDRRLDFASAGRDRQMQEDVFVSDGTEQIWEPLFVWHGFRYFEILGKAEAVDVAVVHSDVKKTAAFTSSSSELNWLFETYLRTQLNNMHAGVPSDCPHRERLGYTGDGQLCAPAGMMLLDTKDFYRKWMRDIFDSQDPETGHVNYTAPFAGGGGGPGGWGGAAIYVPYYFYRAFGETAHLAEYYERMKRWIGYMVAHSENGLVISGEKDGWCLGDWCTLEKTVIPEPFVNTCLLIQTLTYISKISKRLGHEEDLSEWEKISKNAIDGVYAAYYDREKGSFCEGIQGADAIALAVGIGDDRTYGNLYKKYKDLGHFDTGIFGTPMLMDLLFANGDEDLAYDLLTSHDMGSFGYMMDHGATTLWEQWDGIYSHDHPMFGVCTQYLISSILGITQTEDSVGYEKLLISPKIPKKLSFAKGSLQIPCGTVGMNWQQTESEISFEIELPEGLACDFVWGKEKRTLKNGVNRFTLAK